MNSPTPSYTCFCVKNKAIRGFRLFVRCLALCHVLNQCWLSAKWTLRRQTLQSIDKFHNVVCMIIAILSVLVVLKLITLIMLRRILTKFLFLSTRVAKNLCKIGEVCSLHNSVISHDRICWCNKDIGKCGWIYNRVSGYLNTCGETE